MFKKKKERKQKSGVSKFFDSRKGAFRGFKRDYGISKSEQPDKVINSESAGADDFDLDERNKRLYIFEERTNIFGRLLRKLIHLREDKSASYEGGEGNQEQHFNAGYPDDKLKDHYYFKKKKRK